MRDTDVRVFLKSYLRNQHCGTAATLLVEEFDVLKARVDVAVFNGEMNGFEIKSDRDTLSRLPIQRDAYNLVFERISLVLCESHSSGVHRIVPDWWGLLLVDGNGIREERAAEKNPSLCAESLAKLLWRSELIEVLEVHRLDTGIRSKPRPQLIKRLVSNFSVDEISQIVRCSLKSRTQWRGDWI